MIPLFPALPRSCPLLLAIERILLTRKEHYGAGILSIDGPHGTWRIRSELRGGRFDLKIYPPRTFAEGRPLTSYESVKNALRDAELSAMSNAIESMSDVQVQAVLCNTILMQSEDQSEDQSEAQSEDHSNAHMTSAGKSIRPSHAAWSMVHRWTNAIFIQAFWRLHMVRVVEMKLHNAKRMHSLALHQMEHFHRLSGVVNGNTAPTLLKLARLRMKFPNAFPSKTNANYHSIPRLCSIFDGEAHCETILAFSQAELFFRVFTDCVRKKCLKAYVTSLKRHVSEHGCASYPHLVGVLPLPGHVVLFDGHSVVPRNNVAMNTEQHVLLLRRLGPNWTTHVQWMMANRSVTSFDFYHKEKYVGNLVLSKFLSKRANAHIPLVVIESIASTCSEVGTGCTMFAFTKIMAQNDFYNLKSYIVSAQCLKTVSFWTKRYVSFERVHIDVA